MRKIAILLLIALLSGCINSPTIYAPVSDASTIDRIPDNGLYRVYPGDSLYSIAWRYGLDYSYLAKLNHLSPPYAVTTGQMLRLNGKIIARKKHAKVDFTVKKEHFSRVDNWQWPAQGTVIGLFSESNKGINIKGQLNDPVTASAAGKVVYSGSGLRGYGNLIIIQHNNKLLTAYAHNNVILVKEGDYVQTGQKIAQMGNTGARTVMLHFEIRLSGKPVNPLNYLAKR